MIKYKLQIIDIIKEAKDTNTYLLEKPEDLIWEEGANTHLGLVGFDEGEKPNKNLVRHMSISTLPSENTIGITTRVRDTSEFKQQLRELGIGDSLVLFKLGSRMQVRRSQRPLILLSSGVAIATLRPVLLAYANDPTDVPYLVNVNVDSSQEYVFRKELDGLASETIQNHWMPSRAAFYQVVDNLANGQDAIYYVVGSDEFIMDVIQVLKNHQVNENDIILDKRESALTSFFGAE